MRYITDTQNNTDTNGITGSRSYIKMPQTTWFDPIIISYIIMIISLVINGNKYHASIRFVLFQTVLAIVISLFSIKSFIINTEQIKSCFPIIILIFLSIISTYKSNVVGWTTTSTSLIVYSLVFVLFTIQTYKPSVIRSILSFFATFTLTLAIVLIFCLLTKKNIVDGRVSLSFFGVRKDENYLSAILAYGFYYYFMSYLFGSHKKRYIIYSIIIFFSFFMTGSRGALVAAIAGLGIIIVLYYFQEKISIKSFLFSLFLFFLVIISYFIIRNTSLFSRMTNMEGYKDNIRIKIWEYAMEAYRRNPILGSGIQSGTYYAQLHLRWYTHSCFVDLITSTGLLGLFMFILQIWFFYKRASNISFTNALFTVGLTLILFVPLIFINGFETATFWIPLALCKQVSDNCHEHAYQELLV